MRSLTKGYAVSFNETVLVRQKSRNPRLVIGDFSFGFWHLV